MRVIKKSKNSATIELDRYELILLAEVGLEFTQGRFAPDDQGWESLEIGSREKVADLFSSLPVE